MLQFKTDVIHTCDFVARLYRAIVDARVCLDGVIRIRCGRHAAWSRWSRRVARDHPPTLSARSTINSFTTHSVSSAWVPDHPPADDKLPVCSPPARHTARRVLWAYACVKNSKEYSTMCFMILSNRLMMSHYMFTSLSYFMRN